MDAHIGDGVEPELGGGVDCAEVEQLEAVQQIRLDIANAVFDAALLVAGADVADADVKSPMACEIKIARIEHWSFAHYALQYGRLKIVDHEARRTALECGERLLMGGEEMLHGR